MRRIELPELPALNCRLRGSTSIGVNPHVPSQIQPPMAFDQDEHSGAFFGELDPVRSQKTAWQRRELFLIAWKQL